MLSLPQCHQGASCLCTSSTCLSAPPHWPQRLQAEPYESVATLYFQRCSVVATELLLLTATWHVTR